VLTGLNWLTFGPNDWLLWMR